MAVPLRVLKVDAEAVTDAGLSAGLVNVIVEAVHPLVALAADCPLRILALLVSGLLVGASGSITGTGLRYAANFVLAATLLYAGALGVNKGVAQIKQLPAKAQAMDHETVAQTAPTPRPRRPGDEW